VGVFLWARYPCTAFQQPFLSSHMYFFGHLSTSCAGPFGSSLSPARFARVNRSSLSHATLNMRPEASQARTSSGSNVIPRRAHPGLASLRPHRFSCARSELTTKGPSWGYPSPVLGAVAPFLSTFGENHPRFLQNLSKLTLEYPHEGPCVVASVSALASRYAHLPRGSTEL